MISTQNDYGLGFSVVPSVREGAEKIMEDAFARGRLCIPPGHRGRNLISSAPLWLLSDLSGRREHADFQDP